MRILTVIPITNNPVIEELTYFSLHELPLGSLVHVPIRNKETPAIVIDSRDASDMKAILRSNNFALKRLGVTQPCEIIPPSFIQTAIMMADYYATSAGSIISTMIPKTTLESVSKMSKQHASTKPKKPLKSEIYALQSPFLERVVVYKNTIREAFAKKESVILLLPTIVAAQKMYDLLHKGLPDRVYLQTSNSTKTQQLKMFKHMHESDKSVLLISTAKYATLFRDDLGTIIIEDEASTTYHTLKKPNISTAKFMQTYAQIAGLKLILGGTVLSAHTHLMLDKGIAFDLAPQSSRARSKVTVAIIDTRSKKEDPDEVMPKKKNNTFTAISEHVHANIKDALEKKKKVFILAPRRGLAPLTVCQDCKTPVVCNACQAPVTLRKKENDSREFLCYKCGETKDADTTCSYCNSWRLDTLGIGIELIEDELKKTHKKAKIVRVDKHCTKTDKQIQTAIGRFEKDGGILLGTQLALPFMSAVDVSIIASLDAMLSVPNFNIDEHVFALILRVKDITNETLSIQTRMPDRSVIVHAKDGDISAFIREELSLRKLLKYPPYTVMIKITRTGSKRQIIEDFQKIMPELEPYGPRVFKQFHQVSVNKFALHALLRIQAKDYPNKKLTGLLKSIQPTFEVTIDMD